MFLRTNPSQTGHTRDGQQKAGGPFLILFSQHRTVLDPPGAKFTGPDGKDYYEIRAAVRSVRMSQCGHFMMGSAQLGLHRITLSGTYGNDGLTEDPDKYPGLWETLVPVPNDLAFKMWTDNTGWNSAGAEGPGMRQWAIENEKLLRKAGK